MRDKIKRAIAELEVFEKSRGTQHLEKAVEHLEEVDLLALKQVDERQVARHELLHAWCRTLTILDNVKDPNFDPDDVPLLNVGRPLDGSNEIPPKSVSPAAQKQYEAAVAANETKKAQRRTQFLVRELEDRAVESTHRMIKRMYTSSTADQKELAAIFADTKLPQSRQKQLMGQPK